MSTPNLSKDMPALVWEAAGTMILRKRPIPQVGPDEVLIQVACAGICGSELSGYLGHNALRVPPQVMGHEFSGEIVTLGSQAKTINPELFAGARVTANPLVYCGECIYCQRGLNQLCSNRILVGAHRQGAFAGFISVPAKQVVLLPDEVSYQAGALAEPAACGVRIAKLVGELEDEVVLVTGAGTIGLMALQAMKIMGAKRVFITDINPQRLATAVRYGGEAVDPQNSDVVQAVRSATGGLGAAAAVDAVGLAQTRQQCISATRSTGTVILSGLHEESSVIPVADVIRREISLKGSFAYSPDDFQQAVKYLASKAIKLDEGFTQANLAEGGAWFDRLVEGSVETAKVFLIP